ncbi:MAG: xanthine dehydrogenase family protein subunit M [Alphaproteobacteria bacterium]|nr:xanthine dehydrogenase family protein subunit M [Alphaproteobacteria bacterium]
MKPPAFDYVTATSVAEAVALLAEQDGAKLLAGGQSLVPMLNFRLLQPTRLVDINAIPGLAEIQPTPDGGVRIGAMTRHRTVETSALIAARFPVIAAAMTHVAHLAIRNRGTIGGSLSHGDPAAELPLMAVLLDAQLTVVGPKGERVIAAQDFFQGALTTALDDTEMLTEIVLPGLPPRTGWGFEEFARRHGDFAIAAAAATLTIDGGRCMAARLALIGAGETVLRSPAAEAVLVGQTVTPDVIAAAADAAQAAADPRADLQASADFRRHLVAVMSRRALTAAARA